MSDSLPTCRECEGQLVKCPNCTESLQGPDTYCPVCDRCSMCNFRMTPKDDYKEWPTLYNRVREWSDVTFGNSNDRGPIGPLRHVIKEICVEMFSMGPEAWARIDDAITNWLLYANDKTPTTLREATRDKTEYADLQILLCDALWRAGISTEVHLHSAHEKMDVNVTRVYPRRGPDDVTEHDRTLDDEKK